jgi:hypothetical protein
MTKKLLSKNCFFASFFEITFYWCTFSQFHLQIWNKHKILRFLVPILTYLRKKNLACILKKIFSVKIGQNGYQNAQNFILIPNLKTKLRKRAQIKIYLEKTSKRAVFCEQLFC